MTTHPERRMPVSRRELLKAHPELDRPTLDFDPKLVPGILSRGVYFLAGQRRGSLKRAVWVDSHGIVRLEADVDPDDTRECHAFEEAAEHFADLVEPRKHVLHLEA